MPISQQLILQISDKAVLGFKPFPFEPITISGFSDTVTVLSSLAKPKKLTMIGSNGNSYIFLCKPNDDLRKDCRMMEVNTMLNKLLKKDPETRQRELRIRTYSVITLNEDNGLIEWVPNTSGYRHLLSSLYSEIGIPESKQKEEIRKVYANSGSTPPIPEWKKLIQGFYPPIFYKWFLVRFPEPSAWFNARLAYARTTALMSMVGYIVGLGDRHGENILLDSSTGELMHVDFSCLFWKGMKLGTPEKVPFRLTHNMVDALGFTGYEGTFRRVCEISMRLLRHHKEALTSALEAFLYDPLVEWNDKKNDAKGTLADVQERLEGKMRHILNRGQLLLPLGVEGHVHLLIQEATKDENLSSMYVGWASFL